MLSSCGVPLYRRASCQRAGHDHVNQLRARRRRITDQQHPATFWLKWLVKVSLIARVSKKVPGTEFVGFRSRTSKYTTAKDHHAFDNSGCMRFTVLNAAADQPHIEDLRKAPSGRNSVDEAQVKRWNAAVPLA